ncbi:MAG: hypothetical protein AAF202_07345 [Pseudomonadota bacterium]
MYLVSFAAVLSAVCLAASAQGQVLSVIQASEDRNYFFFADQQALIQTTQEICGTTDGIGAAVVTKEVLRPQIAGVILDDGSRLGGQETLDLLRQTDISGDMTGLDHRTIPVMIQQMNRIYD